MNYIFSFEKLDVWGRAKEFVLTLYNVTNRFPKQEKYGLVSQLNRAAVSIVSNLAEGSARNTNKDKAHFYQIAFGSLMEVVSLLIIARDLTFIGEKEYCQLRENTAELSNKINALYKYQLTANPIKQLNNLTVKHFKNQANHRFNEESQCQRQ